MKTELFYTEKGQSEIEKAAGILKKGGILAFPTETVCGLGADISSEKAVKKIFQVKERSFAKPLTIHAADFDSVRQYIKHVPKEAEALIEKYLPGPLMLIFEKTDLVPDYITGGLHKIGIRISSNETFKALINAFGAPIAATSANKSGSLSPSACHQVIKTMDGLIDGILIDEDDIAGVESTIIDVSAPLFRLMRSGFISSSEIAETCGKTPLLSDDGSLSRTIKLVSKLKIIIVEGERVKTLKRIKKLYEHYNNKYDKVGLLLTDGSEAHIGSLPNIKFMGSIHEPEVISNGFFSCIRAFEKEDMDAVIVEGISREGNGWAVMDRLCAAASEVIQDSSTIE